MDRPASRRRAAVPLLLLLLALVALELFGLGRLSLTYDEPEHLQYGLNLLHGNADRFDDSKMPVTAANALPRRLAEALPPGPVRDALEGATAARLATVLGSLLLALLVHRWASELYGARAGLLALALYVLDPNLLAHGRLVTTDLWEALAVTLALYAFWRFERRPAPPGALRAGAALGLAQIAKYTSLLLYPLFALLALLSARGRARDGAEDGDNPAPARPGPRARKGLLLASVLVLASLAVVDAGFLFRKAGTPFGAYRFRAPELRAAQAAHPAWARLPVPVPYPYLEGLDWVRARERSGKGFGNLYLFGELRRDRGFPGYYLVAYLFKVPLAAQLLLLLALARFRRWRDPSFLRDEVFLLLPVVAYWFYFNFLYNAQIGIRYILFTFPLLQVFTASLLDERRGPPPQRLKLATGALLAWQAVSVFSYAPHYLPYFNELVPDRKRAYRILADSNLDWGQGEWYLARYRELHPDAIVDPKRPTAGRLVVSVNLLTGVRRPDQLRWLRRNFEPVDHVAHCYLVYRVTPADLARLGLGGKGAARHRAGVAYGSSSPSGRIRAAAARSRIAGKEMPKEVVKRLRGRGGAACAPSGLEILCIYLPGVETPGFTSAPLRG